MKSCFARDDYHRQASPTPSSSWSAEVLMRSGMKERRER